MQGSRCGNRKQRLSSWRLARRRMLQASLGLLGLNLPQFLELRGRALASSVAEETFGKAKSCIVLYCWGGMSHHETWDPKPNAPTDVRGEFNPIATSTPGIEISEHLPRLAQQTHRLAIVRSMHHSCTAHGKAMYWNMTGHPPPQPELAVNLTPSRSDWPSLGAVVSEFRPGSRGVPSAVRLPYPLVDNGTLQAGEYAGWLGVASDPVVMRTPVGKPFGGVSRDLGAVVLDLAGDLNRPRLQTRRTLLEKVEKPAVQRASSKPFDYFRRLAMDMLLGEKVRQAFDLESENSQTRAAYGEHLCGQSMLLARRLTEAGVPIVTVCCAAGDLNGAKGDHWDTHGDNFNRLKNTMLPTFDKPAAALLVDLADRGRLDETLVVVLTEFGRTPKINRSAGRDHYPGVYSVALAGGGIRGGQVYGSSDSLGAHPGSLPCGPANLQAAIFHAMGIHADSPLHDHLGRTIPITDAKPLPLF